MGVASDGPASSGGGARSAGTEQSGDGPRTVVVAVDGTASSLRAVSYAAGLARRNGAVLTLVHVRKVPSTAAWLGSVGAPIEEMDLEDRGLTVMEQLANVARSERGVEVECAVCDGVTTREIARVADELHADAVVVGCSRSRLHRIAGSVAARLVRRGSWPVTVVP